MKSVTLTPCWFVHEIIGAAAFEEQKPQTSSRCGLSNIIFEHVPAGSGKAPEAVIGEQEIAASVSGSRIVPCSITKSIGSSIPAEMGKSWKGNWYRLTAQWARTGGASAWKLPSCSGGAPERCVVV